MTVPPEKRPDPAVRSELDDAPPVLGSWRNIYFLVAGVLLALIVLFFAITRAYA